MHGQRLVLLPLNVMLDTVSHLLLEGSSYSGNIDWNDIIKKEARGLEDYDLGEVQEVNEWRVVTKKGVVDKDKFYLPRSKAIRFDEDKLWFSVTKDEAKAYKHD